ncbi:MAG: hypothetical protein LBN23_04735 [Paludibacter sp.]|nr:hypothetical protein [Paludibacter sp.]
MFYDISDGYTVIINSQTGVYYGINTLGTTVFQSLVGGVAPDAILAEFLKMENLPDGFQQHFADFIALLLQYEILTEGEIVGKTVSIDREFAAQNNFELNIQEFSDAQEMLLSDPIHDVDEDKGWQPIIDVRKK